MGKSKLQTPIIALLLILAAASHPTPAQSQNSVVQLQPNETTIIEGPLLGGHSCPSSDDLAQSNS
ncbi:MAG: hypothetical protein ACR2PF_20575 [Rhizobiaceae bacterium]